jgi:hypothetical protein
MARGYDSDTPPFNQGLYGRLTVQLRETAVRGKQGHLSHTATMVFDHINGFHPRGLLAVIDLPEVKNLPLDEKRIDQVIS